MKLEENYNNGSGETVLTRIVLLVILRHTNWQLGT